MPAFVNVSRLLIIGLLFFSLSANSHAINFNVHSAQLEKIENSYLLNAHLKYPLTARVKEAIENSITLTFWQAFRLVRSVPIIKHVWYRQKTVWMVELNYELRYHALSKQYTLKALDTGKLRNFPTLELALSSLGTIKAFNLPQAHTLDTHNLTLQIRSGLNLYALPTPMRPGALISTKWHLNSPWSTVTWP